MGLFTRTKPYVDLTMGDPAYGHLVDAAHAGNWPFVREFLSRQTDPREVGFYLRAVTQTEGTERWLRQISQSDGSPLARVVYATRLLDLTKNFLAKGEQWPPIEDTHRWNKEAEQLLQTVVAQEPDNVTAWWLLARASRRERLGEDETARRFSQAVSRCPEHLPAHEAMMMQLRWIHGAAHRIPLEFAQAAMRRRAGSPLGVLVVETHLQRWWDTDLDGLDYFSRPEILTQLFEAVSWSIWHRDYQPRQDWLRIHNMFAFVFALAEQPAYAKRIFKVIGDRVTRYPWVSLKADAVTAFSDLRAQMKG